MGDRLGIGIDRHRTVRAVEKHGLARRNAGGDVAQTRHDRNRQGTGQQGHVTGRRAAVGGESEHVFLRKLDGLRGREIVSHHNGGRLEIQTGIPVVAGQLLLETPFDVVDITDAFAEIRIVHPPERGACAVHRLTYGRLGVEVVDGHVVFGFLRQCVVFENHQVTLEHAHVGSSRTFLQNRDQVLKIALRLDHRPLQTEKLFLLLARRDDELGNRNLTVPAVNENGAGRETAGRGKTRNGYHGSLTAHPECRTCVRPVLPAHRGLRWPEDRRRRP